MFTCPVFLAAEIQTCHSSEVIGDLIEREKHGDEVKRLKDCASFKK